MAGNTKIGIPNCVSLRDCQSISYVVCFLQISLLPMVSSFGRLPPRSLFPPNPRILLLLPPLLISHHLRTFKDTPKKTHFYDSRFQKAFFPASSSLKSIKIPDRISLRLQLCIRITITCVRKPAFKILDMKVLVPRLLQ